MFKIIDPKAIKDDEAEMEWCRGLLEELVSSEEGRGCKEPLYVKLPTAVVVFFSFEVIISKRNQLLIDLFVLNREDGL